MSELKFDVTLNSSEFLEKTELMRSAIQAAAVEIEQQGQRIGSSFGRMAGNARMTIDVIGAAIKGMQEQINVALSALRKLDIENQERLKKMQTDTGKSSGKKTHVANGDKKDSAQKEIGSREVLATELGTQFKGLTELNAELQNYLQRLKLAKSELAGLCSQMAEVTKEMDLMRQAGENNTEAYAKLEKKAGELSDELASTLKQTSKSPISDGTLTGLLSGLEGISGACSAAAAEIELFSGKSEFLETVLQKVQLAVEMVNGVQAVNNMLNKESAFQLNVVGKLKVWWRNITLQAAAAQGVETVAARTGSLANLGLAGSFRAVGLAIKSIPVIGWILAGISALISLYSLWTSRTKEQRERQEEINKSMKDFNESVQQHAAKPIATIEMLSIKFKALGNDMDAQKKFITDNKKAFDELGVSIHSVKDAQQLLIDNKDKFIKAQMDKAISLAYQEKMQEEAKLYVEALAKADSLKEKRKDSVWEGANTVKNLLGSKGKEPSNQEKTPIDRSYGMFEGNKYMLTADEIEEKAYRLEADQHKKKMQQWGTQSLPYAMRADSTLAEINPGGKNTNPNNGKNTKQVKEAHRKLMDLLSEQTAERERFAKDSQARIEQAEIDALPDGSEKTLRQMNFNHSQEMKELEREEIELKQQRIKKEQAIFDAQENLKKAKNSTYEIKEFNPIGIELSLSEADEFRERRANLAKKQAREREAYYESEKQAMNEYLKEYGTYIDKRRAIMELGESRKKGKNEGEQKLIDEETKKALNEVDMKAAESSKSFSELFSGAKNRTVKDLRAIATEAQRTLDFIEKGDWDAVKGEQLGISEESFNAVKNSPEELDKIKQSIQGIIEQADASDTTFNKMVIGFEKLFDAGADPDKVTEALNQIEGAMNEVMQGAQFLSGCLSQLGDAFGNGTLSGIAEGMNAAMDAAHSAMSGAQAGAVLGPWGAAAGAALGLVSSLGASLSKIHDAKHEKKIQRIQDQIEVLEKSYDNLGDSLDGAFSSDASHLIEQQNTLLAQQKVLIQNQIAEEKSKKKTDWDRVKDWENQLESIDKVMAENAKKKIDVIFGEDVQSAIENFAQAYADVWSAGDERAKTSKDLVKNMIKQMIMEAIKSASSKPMEQLREKLAGFFSDGIVSAWEREQIEKDAEEIMRNLDREFSWADEYMKEEEKDSSSSGSSSQKGFAAMSEDTGNELNGRFTALQISNEEIKNSMFAVVGNLSSLCSTTSSSNFLLTDMRNLAVMSNGHLEDIAKYAKMMTGFGEKLDNIEYNTKSLISR